MRLAIDEDHHRHLENFHFLQTKLKCGVMKFMSFSIKHMPRAKWPFDSAFPSRPKKKQSKRFKNIHLPYSRWF